MSDLHKHAILCRYLQERGHIDKFTKLAVHLRLCEEDRWLEHDVTFLWSVRDRIYYCTPSIDQCGLWATDRCDVRNSAYLCDQLLGDLSKRDRNLF